MQNKCGGLQPWCGAWRYPTMAGMLVLACQGRKATLFSLAFCLYSKFSHSDVQCTCALASHLALCLFGFSQTLCRNVYGKRSVSLCTLLTRGTLSLGLPLWFDLGVVCALITVKRVCMRAAKQFLSWACVVCYCKGIPEVILAIKDGGSIIDLQYDGNVIVTEKYN